MFLKRNKFGNEDFIGLWMMRSLVFFIVWFGIILFRVGVFRLEDVFVIVFWSNLGKWGIFGC